MSEEEVLDFSMAECPSCNILFFFNNRGFKARVEKSASSEKAEIYVYCPKCGSDFPFFPESAPRGTIETEEKESMDDHTFSSILTNKDWIKIESALKTTKAKTNRDFLIMAADYFLKTSKDDYELLQKNPEDVPVLPISNLERLIEVLELRLAERYLQSSSEKVDFKKFGKKSNIFSLGLKTAMTELNELKKILSNLGEKKVKPEKGFYFYENLGRPLNISALSLIELLRSLENVPTSSIEFHQERRDFSNWIRHVLGYEFLAEAVQDQDAKGEELRRRLMNTLLNRTLK